MNDNDLWRMREDIDRLSGKVRTLTKDLEIMSCRVQTLELAAKQETENEGGEGSGRAE